MTRLAYARRAARRLFRDCAVGDRVDEDRARGVVVHIIEAHRREGPVLLSEFHRLLRLHRDRHRAEIRSAVPLPDDLRARIDARLSRARGPGLQRSFVVDPSLVGGLRIQIGSDVYDASVRGRLAALEERISSGGRT